MPWKSEAQRRWGNSPAGHKALGDSGVDEWNAASKGMKLPKHKAGGGGIFPLYAEGGSTPTLNYPAMQSGPAPAVNYFAEHPFGMYGKHGLDLSIPLGSNTDMTGRASMAPNAYGPDRHNYDVRFGVRQRFAEGGSAYGEPSLSHYWDQLRRMEQEIIKHQRFKQAGREAGSNAFYGEIDPEVMMRARGLNPSLGQGDRAFMRDPRSVTFPNDSRKPYSMPPEYVPDVNYFPPNETINRANPYGLMRAAGGAAEPFGGELYDPNAPEPAPETYEPWRKLGEAFSATPEDYGGKTSNIYKLLGHLYGGLEDSAKGTMEASERLRQTGEYNAKEPFMAAVNTAGMSMPFAARGALGMLGGKATVPTFYSGLERAIETAPQATATPSQWLGSLKKAKGTRPEEFEWTGLEDYLKQRNAGLNQETQVSKNELLGYMRQNKLNIEEHQFGAFHPGHKETQDLLNRRRDVNNQIDDLHDKTWESRDNYQKALRNNPDDPGDALYDQHIKEQKEFRERLDALNAERERLDNEYYGKDRDYKRPQHDTYRFKFDDPNVTELPETYGESVLAAKDLKGQKYRVDVHWPGVDNPLAHGRYSMAEVDGERTIVAQEFQSDIHNAGKMAKGYKKPGETFDRQPPPDFEDYVDTVGRRLDPQLADKYKNRYNLPNDEFRNLDRSGWMTQLRDEHRNMSREYREAANLFRFKPPNAPLKGERWIEAVVKDAIRKAAETGATQVMIPAGLHQAEIWKKVQRGTVLNWAPHADPEYFTRLYGKDKLGNPRIGQLSVTDPNSYAPHTAALSEAELKSRLGQNLYDRLVNSQEPSLHIPGNKRLTAAAGEEPFAVGGKERINLYDSVIKNVINNVIKPFGGKIGIRPTGGKEFYSGKHQTYNNMVFKVTPEMVEHALHKGWPFKRGGGVIRRAAGGPIPATPNIVKGGLLHSDVPGRTDDLNINVPSGAYVIPADIVAGEGQGNTIAGSKKIHSMFSGPLGMPALKKKGHQGKIGMGHAQRLRTGHLPRGSRIRALESPFADGGAPEMPPEATEGEETPILAAGGEYIVHPHMVRKMGRGDLKEGHRVLDAFVLHARKQHIKQIKNLKPPVKT